MTDQHFMAQALREAHTAYEGGEVPVGAVIVLSDQVIARGHNQVELLKDCTAHAEMLALTSAFHYCGSKYLPEATLYVTIEPCLMCCGALRWSQIGRIVFGAPDVKNGFRKYFKSTENPSSVFHPKTQVSFGVLENDCEQLMKSFFSSRR